MVTMSVVCGLKRGKNVESRLGGIDKNQNQNSERKSPRQKKESVLSKDRIEKLKKKFKFLNERRD